MPEPDDVGSWWKRFIQSLRSLTQPLAEHRHEDQFLRVRDAALALGESEEMVRDIRAAYTKALTVMPPPLTNEQPRHPEGLEPPAAIVAIELQSFTHAVEIHEAAVKAGSAKPGALDSLRRIGKTVLESVGEIFELSPWGKGVLHVLKEILELGGKE